MQMLFIIAGISPKTKTLDQNPRRCSRCGLNQVYEKRIDHWLSLFFIPIFRVKKGEPFSMCVQCAGDSDARGPDLSGQPQDHLHVCRFCRKPLAPDFTYCPYCGRSV